MAKFTCKINNFKVVQSRTGYVIINEKLKYENHSHIKNMDTAFKLIRLIQKTYYQEMNI